MGDPEFFGEPILDDMLVVVVSSKEEIDAAYSAAAQQGKQIACSSNAGLPRGKMRLTFLPKSAFTNTKEQEIGVLYPRRGWFTARNFTSHGPAIQTGLSMKTRTQIRHHRIVAERIPHEAR